MGQIGGGLEPIAPRTDAYEKGTASPALGGSAIGRGVLAEHRYCGLPLPVGLMGRRWVAARMRTAAESLGRDVSGETRPRSDDRGPASFSRTRGGVKVYGVARAPGTAPNFRAAPGTGRHPPRPASRSRPRPPRGVSYRLDPPIALVPDVAREHAVGATRGSRCYPQLRVGHAAVGQLPVPPAACDSFTLPAAALSLSAGVPLGVDRRTECS